jgi:hypothetical protein
VAGGGRGESRNNSVRLVCISADIWISFVQNTSQKSGLAGSYVNKFTFTENLE